MAKALLSPLASGLIIPGLGQVLNHHLKKGLALLVITLGLFVAFLGQSYAIINFMVQHSQLYRFDPEGITKAIADYHPIGLFVIIFGFVAVWIYSVVDALIYGIRLDRKQNKD